MRRTSLASPSVDIPVHAFPPTTKAVAMQVLILTAIVVSVAGALGFLFPFQMSESVALVGMGCLFAILARIVQVVSSTTRPTCTTDASDVGRGPLDEFDLPRKALRVVARDV